MALQSTAAISSVTLQSSSSTIVFSNIPSIYRDIVIVVEGNVTASLTPRLRFNADEGSNYNFVSAAADNSNTTYRAVGATTFVNPAPDFGTPMRFNITYQIIEASQSNKHKLVLSRYGLSGQSPNMVATRWAGTNPISTITFSSSANEFAAGTVISVYGRIA